MPKAGSNCIFLKVLLIDFVLKNYLQVFLKECKYIEKEKQVIRYITDDPEIPFDNFWWKIDST